MLSHEVHERFIPPNSPGHLQFSLATGLAIMGDSRPPTSSTHFSQEMHAGG